MRTTAAWPAEAIVVSDRWHRRFADAGLGFGRPLWTNLPW